MAAAYRALARHGFEGLRTRDVASTVGVNIATLHYYFPTKEGLIRAVVGHAMSRFRSTLAQDGSAIERLRGHLRGLRRLSREEPQLFAVMAELMTRSARDRAIAEIVRTTTEYWQSSLRNLLRASRDEGDLPLHIEADGMAAVIVAALKGAYLLPAGSGRPEALDKTLRQLERLLGLRSAR